MCARYGRDRRPGLMDIPCSATLEEAGGGTSGGW